MKYRQLIELASFNHAFECKHEFSQRGDDLVCHYCKWVKYKIEIEGEKQLMRRIERVSRRVEIKTKHISLFQF